MEATRANCAATAAGLLIFLCGSASPASASGYWRFEEAGGTTVVDSGPFGLDGTLNTLPVREPNVAVNPVPQNDLANTQSLNLNWQSTSSGGRVTIADSTGQLSFGDASFTIEAWVKLEHVSDANSADEQQWLIQKKPLPSADSELDYALLVQAGSHGTNGRELSFVYGDKGAAIVMLSTLEIANTGWHFVSVAYDNDAQALRFGLDCAFEIVPLSKPAFVIGGPMLNSGALRIGSHQNSAGTNNRFVRGAIDEVRITRGFLPVDQLLDSPWPDCNTNGVSDAVDILSSTSADCNGNFVPDDCDIAGGASQDCQPDGIPDDCQLADQPAYYRWEDGRAEATVLSDGDYTGWLQHFVVSEGVSLITDVDIFVSDAASGKNMSVYIWSDPDGDGDPTDARVLASLPVSIDASVAGRWNRFDLPDVDFGSDGVSFFVGALMEDVDPGATTIEFTPPHVFGVSWIVGRNSPIDPNDLSAGAVEFAPIETSFPGNWLVRAVHDTGISYADCNGNFVPDDCDIAGGASVDSNGNGVPDECEFAATYYVPDHFGTIQTAINVAAEGSTIIVRPGTYAENLDFIGKALAVRSEHGPEVTTIDGGGGVSVAFFGNGEGSDSILDGFTLTNGTGFDGWGGGGVFCHTSSPTIANNIIENNSAPAGFGGGILVYQNVDPLTIRGNRIANNTTENAGGGVAVFGDNGLVIFEDNVIENNSAPTDHGGGIYAANGAFTVVRNVISGNTSGGSGGGLFLTFSGFQPSVITNNVFVDNSAADDGGGLWFANTTMPSISNNLFVGNSAPFGGAIYARNQGVIANNTIVGNPASVEGGGLFYDDGSGSLVVVNSIIRGNSAPASQDLYLSSPAATVSYCNITGGWTGTGNIDADPLFADPNNADFNLLGGSPCIDAADNTAVPTDAADLDDDGDTSERTPRDLAELRRFVDDPGTADSGVSEPPDYMHVADIGAYEFAIIADLNGDCRVDLTDLALLLSDFDCAYGGCAGDVDGDGDADLTDLALLLANFDATCN